MQTSIVTFEQIQKALTEIDSQTLLQAIEDGFVAYSAGRVTAPPVGYMEFAKPPGDVHIKYGFINDDDFYVIKVAASFYDNPKQGLPSSNGVVLVSSAKTGELLSVLLDQGYLTQVRTAAAGAVVAKYLAPSHVSAIGIVGTGTQARLQLEYLKYVLDCHKVYVYGRSEENLQAYVKDMGKLGFTVTPTQDIRDITQYCNYIVTTTPSTGPLIAVEDVRPGTHITAMGADGPGKQELDALIIQKADIVVADSVSQCVDHGEVADAVARKLVSADKLIELGKLIEVNERRKDDGQVTVADLTGVAVQDIQIAKLVYAQAKG